eukprot:m.216518 g.216518  ORF g.216518 m.216518 type:complete len:459 (+) comp33209_c0_seq1:85-1461(+)
MDLSAMSYRELQAECKRRGLKSVGTTEVLRQTLGDPRVKEPEPQRKSARLQSSMEVENNASVVVSHEQQPKKSKTESTCKSAKSNDKTNDAVLLGLLVNKIRNHEPSITDTIQTMSKSTVRGKALIGRHLKIDHKSFPGMHAVNYCFDEGKYNISNESSKAVVVEIDDYTDSLAVVNLCGSNNDERISFSICEELGRGSQAETPPQVFCAGDYSVNLWSKWRQNEGGIIMNEKQSDFWRVGDRMDYLSNVEPDDREWDEEEYGGEEPVEDDAHYVGTLDEDTWFNGSAMPGVLVTIECSTPADGDTRPPFAVNEMPLDKFVKKYKNSVAMNANTTFFLKGFLDKRTWTKETENRIVLLVTEAEKRVSVVLNVPAEGCKDGFSPSKLCFTCDEGVMWGISNADPLFGSCSYDGCEEDCDYDCGSGEGYNVEHVTIGELAKRVRDGCRYDCQCCGALFTG